MAEYPPLTATTGNLRALCGACTTVMHKAIPIAALAALAGILEVTVRQATKHPSRRLPQGEGRATTAATTTVTGIRAGIVADERWPNMYRLKLGRGQLSEMLSLTRAKDALAQLRGRRP